MLYKNYYFDNIKLKNNLLCTFNVDYYKWLRLLIFLAYKRL